MGTPDHLINEQNEDGQTLLQQYYGRRNSNEETLNLLIHTPAVDFDLQEKNGNTPSM